VAIATDRIFVYN